MYRIIKTDGVEVACVDKPRYIKLHTNGCYVEANELDAEGVAVNGVAYSIFGRDALEGATETVIVSEIDGGKLVAEQQRVIDKMLLSALEV